MTGAFLRIMRPNRCWTILHASILAGLLLTLDAHSEDSDCNVDIMVRRNTVYNALRGQELKINCTVIFCNDSPPAITWGKVVPANGRNNSNNKTTHVRANGSNDINVKTTCVPANGSSDNRIKTEWKPVKKLEGIFYLIFTRILHSDAGQYKCLGGGSVSHFIHVRVHDHGEITTVTQNNTIVSATSVPPSTDDFLLYVYSAAGIAAFVVIVIIISVISMRGCRGKPKKEAQPENQYMDIPMMEQPFPPASSEPSQRGSPSAPPSRRSTKRQAPPRQPDELTLPSDNEQNHGQKQAGRDRQRITVEEESSSVVYAALNHQPPQRPPRLQLAVEESSEYAAIRVA